MAAAAAAAAVGLSPDLQKRINIMAEHVARHGPDFEITVKQKNASSPQFAFLVGGEGSEYYQQLLEAHRNSQGGMPGTGSAFEAAELAEFVTRWREPSVAPLGADGERQLTEIVSSLEHIASRDAIRAGRTWIEAHVGSAHAIAGNIMKRIIYLPTCAHRLHVLFLLHDILQTEISKPEAERLITLAFRPFLVWMLRPSYQLAQSMSPSGEESAKILKLLALWSERGILTAREADEMRAIATAKELPAAAPKPTAQAFSPAHVSPLAPGLVGQQGTRPVVRPSVQVPMSQSASVLGILQNLPVLSPRPTTATGMMMTAPAGFSGVIRPGLVAGTLAATGTVTAGALTSGPLPPGPLAGGLPAPVPLPAAGGQTPETVPVGVMASMLKQVSKRNKDLHTAFVPYKPLEPLYTPQMLPPVGPPSARLLERLAEYYDFLGTPASKDENQSATTLALPAPEATTGTQPTAEAGSPTAGDIATTTSPQATTTAQTGPDGDDSLGIAADKKDSERREKRRIMCASGSRSRSRSPRSPTDAVRAAAAAMAVNAAISPNSALTSKEAERPTAEPTVTTTPARPQTTRSTAIQQLD